MPGVTKERKATDADMELRQRLVDIAFKAAAAGPDGPASALAAVAYAAGFVAQRYADIEGATADLVAIEIVSANYEIGRADATNPTQLLNGGA